MSKRILEILVLILFLATAANGQSPTPSPTPSLEDTLSWLKQKLETHLSSSKAGRGYSSSTVFEAKEFNGCEVFWQTTKSATTSVRDIGIEPEGERVRGNLGDFDASKTDVKTGDMLILLLLYTKSDRSVLEESFRTRYGRETVTPRRTGLISFIFKEVDEATVRRIAKAFNHAVELCAKPNREPF